MNNLLKFSKEFNSHEACNELEYKNFLSYLFEEKRKYSLKIYKHFKLLLCKKKWYHYHISSGITFLILTKYQEMNPTFCGHFGLKVNQEKMIVYPNSESGYKYIPNFHGQIKFSMRKLTCQDNIQNICALVIVNILRQLFSNISVIRYL